MSDVDTRVLVRPGDGTEYLWGIIDVLVLPAWLLVGWFAVGVAIPLYLLGVLVLVELVPIVRLALLHRVGATFDGESTMIHTRFRTSRISGLPEAIDLMWTGFYVQQATISYRFPGGAVVPVKGISVDGRQGHFKASRVRRTSPGALRRLARLQARLAEIHRDLSADQAIDGEGGPNGRVPGETR